tara:strand:+ start:426 stop:1346 length:921 start_codon:yes stop_codon:yes gene_type:complete
MATFTYESLKNKFLNPTVKGNLDLLDDGAIIKIGADDDLQITHSGSAATIDNNTGNLELQVDASAVINLKDQDGDQMISANSNGGVELYHNNTRRLETVAAGAKTTGTFEVTGASTLTGAVTAAAGLTVDNLTLVNGGNEIDVASGDLTLDVAGNIVLDAAGGDIQLKVAGTQYGSLSNNSGNLIIKSGTTTAATFSGANVTFAGTLASGAITSSGDVTAFSDMNLKSDIRTIDNALNKVCDLRGVFFTKDGEAGTGVIAQEIENILPEVVKDGEYKSVAYGNIVGVLIEAIKELRNEVKSLKENS